MNVLLLHFLSRFSITFPTLTATHKIHIGIFAALTLFWFSAISTAHLKLCLHQQRNYRNCCCHCRLSIANFGLFFNENFIWLANIQRYVLFWYLVKAINGLWSAFIKYMSSWTVFFNQIYIFLFLAINW